jgi:Tol biopolymer transport system component/DNA-binding CsgD family transcriptional regulator
MGRGRPKHPDILTPKQWQVLDYLRQGLTNDEIGARMGLTRDGAKYHVSEILTKLGLSTREEAARWEPEGERRRAPLLAPLAWLTKGSVVKTAIGAGGITLAAVAVLLAIALNGPREQGATLGKVAYIEDGDVWVKTLPAGPERQLTDDGAVTRPKLSPSGSWVMFQRTPPAPEGDFGVWLIRTDGRGEHRLTSGGLASWSPIADIVAFTDFSAQPPVALGENVLAIASADGKWRRELLPSVPGGGTLDRRMQPEWSRDGRWVVFEEQHQDHQSQSGGYSYIGLWAVRDDGSEGHELFSATLAEAFEGFRTADGPFPAEWALPSRGAALELSLRPGSAEPFEAGDLPVSLMVDISRDPGDDLRIVGYRDFVALSPDGQTLAVVAGADMVQVPVSVDARTIPPPVDSQSKKQIVLLDAQTGDVQALTDTSMVAVSPAWSPDGVRIAYVARPDTGPVAPADADAIARAEALRRIWVMDADGGNARQLLTDGADCRQERPQWSKDGEQILFACIDGETASLWVAPASGGTAMQVVARISSSPPLGRPATPPQLTGYPEHVDWEYAFDWWQP